jgi:hypothetical protein
MNEKDKVKYLQEAGWIPHPSNPDRFWQSPNHKQIHLTYGTTMAYHSQKAFEEGTTLKKVKARASVSKRMFYVMVLISPGYKRYLDSNGELTNSRDTAKAFIDLKSAVAAANEYFAVDRLLEEFLGFEAVRNA